MPTGEETRRKMAAACKRRYERLKAEGVCVDCGWRKPVSGQTRCAYCVKKRMESPAHMAQIDRYHDRRAQGLCVYCGETARPGLSTCMACAVKRAAWKEKHRRETGK